MKAHLQPRLNALAKLAGKFKVAEEDFWERVVSPCLRGASAATHSASPEEPLDAEQLCRDVEAALAEEVGATSTAVQRPCSAGPAWRTASAVPSGRGWTA